MNFIKKIFSKKNDNNDMSSNYKSSLTDTKDNLYSDFCLKAATDCLTFKYFRTNPIYTDVLEHVDDLLGQEYLNEILRVGNFNETNLNDFKRNDYYGGASIRYYNEVGYFSPSTLRYIKVLSDLITKFGDLKNKNICEIGIGYGGQSRIIMSFFNIKSYTFIDLDSVLYLGKKYLSNFNEIQDKLHFVNIDDLETKEYDLVISNYAFSELRKNIQDIYIEKIIKNSTHGYITYNNIAPENFNYSLENYENFIGKKITIEDEKPNSHPLNKILTW